MRCAVFAAVLFGFTAAPAGIQAAAPPNVVIILADDLGVADLGCQGATDIRTPHLDRLAAEGLRFTNFYANCTVCSPTRAALLTGRFSELVGVPGVIRTHPEQSWGYLSQDAVLLPALLHGAGYHSALVGKWHLGLETPNTPLDRGFDHFHGWLGDMMDDYYTHLRHGINYLRRDREEIARDGHATDLFTTWACEYLRSQAATAQPFFLYLAYNAPHSPVQPPDDWTARVQKRAPDMTRTRAEMVALIEHMDDGIGQVLRTLDDSGLSENTLVMFTSDNGGVVGTGRAANGLWRDGKTSMYEGGLRVPLLVRWPGRVTAGSTTDLRAMTMDLFATVLEAAGAEVPDNIEAVSLLPTLKGGTQPPLRDEWFFTWREGGPRFGGKTIDAVIVGDWKLVHNNAFAPLELYNLHDDPGERHDRAASEPQVIQRLLRSLQLQTQRAGSVPWQPPRR